MAPAVSPPEALIDDQQPLPPEPVRCLVTTREIVITGRVVLGELAPHRGQYLPVPHGASSTTPPGGIRPSTRADLGPGWHDRLVTLRHKRQLIAELERLSGKKVTLQDAI